MYLGAWGLSVFWMPAELWVRVGKDFLLGSIDPVGILYGYPIAPWLAIYLLGSAVGDYAGRAHCSGNEREVNAVLLRAAIGSLFAALMVKGAYKAAAFFYPLDGSSLLYELSNPFTRVPPSPVYVGLFAGLGLLLIWALHQLHRSEICRSMINTIATIGRASLFAFILQYYLYLVVIYSLRAVLPGPAIAWYVLSVMGLYAACAVWDRRGWNRWLTVGFSTVSVPAQITPAPQWTRT